jgi:hypothetical protein
MRVLNRTQRESLSGRMRRERRLTVPVEKDRGVCEQSLLRMPRERQKIFCTARAWGLGGISARLSEEEVGSDRVTERSAQIPSSWKLIQRWPCVKLNSKIDTYPLPLTHEVTKRPASRLAFLSRIECRGYGAQVSLTE